MHPNNITEIQSLPLKERAVAYATLAHGETLDKVGEPYILHPTAVMNVVSKWGEGAQAAAVLHDVVEDCGVTLEDLREYFPESVVSLVDTLTRRGSHGAGESYFEYIRRVKEAGQPAIAIKVEDIRHNSLPDRNPYGRGMLDRYDKALKILTAGINFKEVVQKSLEKIAKDLIAISNKHTVLLKFLSSVANNLGIGQHVYIVGGAIRNFLLNTDLKDFDIVIDSIRAGMNSAELAQKIVDEIPVEVSIATNQYGVAILTVKGEWLLDGENLNGEVIEIANARKESYRKDETHGKGYKPTKIEPSTIEEDMSRRDFSVNSLAWRLLDLAEGPDKAEIIDMLGVGVEDLKNKVLRTPLDPDQTFSDDPTRILRACRFAIKYNFSMPPEMITSIKKNRWQLANMPWEAVASIFVDDILLAPNAMASIDLMVDLGIIEVISKIVSDTNAFATYLGRALSVSNYRVLAKLLQLGVLVAGNIINRMRLDPKDTQKLLNLSSLPDYDELVDRLVHPPVDFENLFETYNVPPASRKNVVQYVRHYMLENPDQPNTKLNEVVSKFLSGFRPES
jgi:tRNA nucleotidyltransferase/poly(A) polymerase